MLYTVLRASSEVGEPAESRTHYPPAQRIVLYTRGTAMDWMHDALPLFRQWLLC